MRRGLIVVAAACLLASSGLWFGLSRSSTSPAAVTEGQTIGADPSTMVDTAKAVSLIDKAKVALCKTTITGVSYFANPGAYVGGQWYQGLAALTLAQALSPAKTSYDTAGSALMLTTISGKRYCAKPVSGRWSLAFSTLASERVDLVANPAQDGPSIVVK